MTEVWKSLGRKYCEFCDCWFADNKVSISFHENGKRHKESVERKVQEIAKKGTERERALKNEKNFLEAMEKGAAKAVQRDIKANPRMINNYFGDDVPIPEESDCAAPPLQYPSEPEGDDGAPPMQGPSLPPAPKKLKKEEEEEKPVAPKLKPNKVWQEVQSPEGYSYYWNVETGQVTWTAPPGGYVSLLEQAASTPGVVLYDDPNAEETTVETPELSQSQTGAGLVHKKSWKERAYGGWSKVKKSEVQSVDLQLPQATIDANAERDRLAAEAASASADAKAIQFKTKTVGSLTSAPSSSRGPAAITFKKRKITSGANSRTRGDDS